MKNHIDGQIRNWFYQGPEIVYACNGDVCNVNKTDLINFGRNYNMGFNGRTNSIGPKEQRKTPVNRNVETKPQRTQRWDKVLVINKNGHGRVPSKFI